MIVIDSSALLAILQQEPERHAMFEAIADADRCLVSAVAYQETGQIQFSRRGAQGMYDLEEFLNLIGAEIVPHDGELAGFAIETSSAMAREFIPMHG